MKEHKKYLEGWHVEIQPVIVSYRPSAFDEQTEDWTVRQKQRRKRVNGN